MAVVIPELTKIKRSFGRESGLVVTMRSPWLSSSSDRALSATDTNVRKKWSGEDYLTLSCEQEAVLKLGQGGPFFAFPTRLVRWVT